MKRSHVSHAGKAVAESTAALGLLEREIADLKQINDRLELRLSEAEMEAELRARADRILAIPPPIEA